MKPDFIKVLEWEYVISTFTPIKGFPGYYINRDGVIYGSRYKIPLKYTVNSHGYHTVGLHINGKSHTQMVHRLIAKEFIPNPENKPHIDHIDGNKINNSLDNLRWVFPQENTDNAKRLGRISFGSAFSVSKLTEDQVIEIRKNYRRFSKQRSNVRMLAKKYNVTVDTIRNVVRRKFWKHVA